MKKLCCILLICMMLFTSLSIPVFAVEINIENLSAQNIDDFKNEVDRIFNVIKDEGQESTDGTEREQSEFINCRGALLDGICCSDLIAKYCSANGRHEEAKEYLLKMYVMAAEMMWCSVDNSIEPFKLELYFLKEAANCVNDSTNAELCEMLINKLAFINTKILKFTKKFEKYKEYSEVEILNMVYSGVPKSQEELNCLLNTTNEIFEDLGDFLEYSVLLIDKISNSLMTPPCSGDEEFDEPDNQYDEFICTLKVDRKKIYSVKNIVKKVLKGQFNFGKQNMHIALGFIL